MMSKFEDSTDVPTWIASMKCLCRNQSVSAVTWLPAMLPIAHQSQLVATALSDGLPLTEAWLPFTHKPQHLASPKPSTPPVNCLFSCFQVQQRHIEGRMIQTEN